MREGKIRKILAVVAMIGIAALAGACDDGRYDFDVGPSPSVSPYVRITADPMTVPKGGSTTLKWTVANADTVQIASADNSEFTFHSEPIDVSGETESSGETVVTGITATTTFIITAKLTIEVYGEPSITPAPYVPVQSVRKSGQIEFPLIGEPTLSESVITDSVTVEVIDAELSATLTANPDHITQGDSSTLKCEYSPENATVTVTDDDGQVIAMDDDCEAEVTPDETTVYTLTVTNSLGETETDTAIVYVEQLYAESADIKANGQDVTATLTSMDEQFSVTYTISPSKIPVTVEVDKSGVNCDPALPTDPTPYDELPGESQCTISEDTTFSLVSHINGVTKTEDFVLVRGPMGSGDVDIRVSQAWAFEGEEVIVEVAAKSDSDVPLISRIVIKGMVDVNIDKSEISTVHVAKTIIVPMTDVLVEIYSPQDEADSPSKIKKAVSALPLTPIGDIDEPITKVLIDPQNINRAYYGVLTDVAKQYRENFSENTVRIYRSEDLSEDASVNGELDIDLGYLMTTFHDDYIQDMMNNSSQLMNDFRDYPIYAITTTQNAIYAGTYGAIVRSQDNGKNWELVADQPIPFWSSAGGQDGTHKSCKGEIARGSESEHDDDLIAWINVCDIVMHNSGNGLIAGTDFGVMVIHDIERAMDDPSDSNNLIWNNSVAKAQPMFGNIVNDIVKVRNSSGTELFAAVAAGDWPNGMSQGEARGVYRSMSADGSDLGEVWESFGTLDVDVYALVVDMDNKNAKKLYAATSDGVYMSDFDTANWTKTGLSEAAFSLADDPYSTDVIVAGLGDGVKVTRDGGDNWGQLIAHGLNSSGKVNSIALVASRAKTSAEGMVFDENGDKLFYRAIFGSKGGYCIGKTLFDAEEVPPQPEDQPEEQPEDQTEDNPLEMVFQVRAEAIPALIDDN